MQKKPPPTLLRLLSKDEIDFLEYQQHLTKIASRVYNVTVEPVIIDLNYDYILITSKKKINGKGKKISQTKELAVYRG